MPNRPKSRLSLEDRHSGNYPESCFVSSASCFTHLLITQLNEDSSAKIHNVTWESRRGKSLLGKLFMLSIAVTSLINNVL